MMAIRIPYLFLYPEVSWEIYIKQFKSYLKLERSLAENSISAYLRDVAKLKDFFDIRQIEISPLKVESHHISDFLAFINEMGISPYSQARILSGIKAFFQFLVYEELVVTDPAALYEAPKLGRKLPDTLSVQEIDLILSQIDHSTPEGMRNRAMLETL